MTEVHTYIYVCYNFSYVSDSPLWPVVEELVSSALKPNTKKSYNSAQFNYITFCNKNNLLCLPASENTLLLFIAHLHSTGLKGQSIRSYLSAVRSMHIMNDFSPPVWSLKISAALKGALRKSSPQSKKHPITVKILSLILDEIQFREDALMFKAAASLCFFGCLRAGEICIPDSEVFDRKVHLCLEDITFYDDNQYMSIFIKRSKTDTFDNGIKVFVGCSGKK